VACLRRCSAIGGRPGMNCAVISERNGSATWHGSTSAKAFMAFHLLKGLVT
jgi:hypothetical protein